MVRLAPAEGWGLRTSLQESLALPCRVQIGVCPPWQGKAGLVLTRPLPGMGSSKVAEKGGKIWRLGGRVQDRT